MSHRPYIGLRPFERTETDIFFGRETHTDELIDRLGSSHFLAVVGTSGCGKSSLVKTGLIAGLEAGYLAKAGTYWRIIEIRPSNQPFQALADKLFSELNDVLTPHFTVDTLQQILQQGSLSLHELLARHPLPNNAQLLIVCDQFEEIFRYFQQGASAEARNFVSLLLASSKPYPVSTSQLSHFVYVVITMRSDFLGDCAQFAGLAEAINQGLYLTPRLDAQQLRAAIEEPAFVFDGEIEPALVSQLLEDAQNNQDQLPLLQHLLMRLWDLASDKTATLTLTDYEAIGGLTNALSRHADEVYDQLTKEQRRIAELLFRSLTERGDAQRDTRRTTPLAEIIELTSVSFAEVVVVINAFRQTRCCFLIPPINVVLSDNSIIDISHESLIRQWQRLKDWTVDEALAAEKYQRLQITASRYAHKEAALLQSPELEMMLQWQKTFKPTPLWAKRYGGDFKIAVNFLQKSAKRRRLKQIIFVVLFIFMSVLAGVATWEWQQAELHKQKALAQQQQKDLALDVISHFTYEIPEALAKIPQTAQLTSSILEYNTQFLDKIYALNPNDKKAQREKASNYSRVGNIYFDLLGSTQKALDYYAKALAISEQLAQQDSQNSQAQRDLLVSFNKLANAQLQLGDTQKALDYYARALTIGEQLTQQDPQDSQAQRDLSVSFEKLADVQLQLGDTKKALDCYEKALTISEQLAQQDLQNSQAQRDLSVSFNKLANVQLQLGDTQKALDYYTKALTIREKLAQQDPQDSQAQRDLSVSFNKLANVQLQLGDTQKALDYYTKDLTISNKLAQQDPQDSQAQKDLKSVQTKLAALEKK